MDGVIQKLMKEIEHDPEEPPRDRTGNLIYWVNFLMLAGLWVVTTQISAPTWGTVFLGIWTGAFIAIWSIEMTGNKAPNWMR